MGRADGHRERTRVRAEIAAERRELADVLADCRPERWDEETLCAGWRVRETLAHITMAFRYSGRGSCSG